MQAGSRAFIGALLRKLRRLLFPSLRKPDALAPAAVDAGLNLIYRFLLARPPDERGRDNYLRLIREDGMTLREVAVEVAASDEFQIRLRNSVRAITPERDDVGSSEPRIDARELQANLSVEALAQTAEDYYHNTIQFKDRYLAKPLDDVHDAPDLLISFAQLIMGLQLAPGMTVLDFGAGTGWTTRWLTQLGCETIALDVSATALQLGRERFARLPPIGIRAEPRFLLFDGRHIELADGSIDRICCVDAFHHVPNPAEVMRELGRVLRPGGIAAFSEPGPHHSDAARSQYEMKNYVAFENDVIMDEIWRWAQTAGFAELELAVFSADSHRVSLREFDDIIHGRKALGGYERQLRAFLNSHRMFFLKKTATGLSDSRVRAGLKAEIAIDLERTDLGHNDMIRGRATVQNVGTVIWLPGDMPVGGVNLGVHLRTRDGAPLAVDFARIRLVQTTAPGDQQTVEFALAPPAPGEYLLEFDLVSEGIAWFEMNGSATSTVAVTVR
jgi:SAM-dependent methyltransferase